MKSFLVISLLAVGCGGDGSSTELDGIYNVATWTRNDTSCDVEGASIKDQQQPVFFVKYEKVLDYAAINVRSCDDLAQCRMEYADDGTIHIGAYSFQKSDDGWTGQDASASLQSNVCVGQVHHHRLDKQGAGVRIETRGRDYFEFAPEAGQCTEDAAVAVEATMPCGSLEVLTGTLVER